MLKTGGGTIHPYSADNWRKGRVSNPHVPKDHPASNGPPLGRNSAYLSTTWRAVPDSNRVRSGLRPDASTTSAYGS